MVRNSIGQVNQFLLKKKIIRRGDLREMEGESIIKR